MRLMCVCSPDHGLLSSRAVSFVCVSLSIFVMMCTHSHVTSFNLCLSVCMSMVSLVLVNIGLD